MPSRKVLLEAIDRLVAANERLRGDVGRLSGRVAELEAELAGLRAETERPRPPSWVKPNVPERPAGEAKKRKKREGGFVRERSPGPTQRIVHAVEDCPDCGCHLLGGWVKRHRETIEIPPPHVEVVGHVLVEGVCPRCGQAHVPALGPAEGAVGRRRLGPRLMSLIGAPREEGRMPIEVIRRHLQTIYRLTLSVGAIDGVLKALATKGEATVKAIRAQIRQSDVVHADETGWREDGKNRYSWLIATERAAYLEVGRRTTPQIDQILGADFGGVLVTDFYGAYDHFDCPKQRCWAHTIRTQLRNHHVLGRRRGRDRVVERDDVVDLQRVRAHDNALDQQLQDRLLLRERHLRQSAAHALAEGRQLGQHLLSARLLPAELGPLALLVGERLAAAA
jgi:transposase